MSSNHRKSFICTEGGKHNRTPTQAHTSRYSRHLRHALESVGLHRSDILRCKIQVTSLHGAGACAHERRTGVVAAEAAAAKGGCPRYGRARHGTLVGGQSRALLGTDRRAQQLVVVQIKPPVSRRNRELGNQLQGILRQTNKQTNMHNCVFVKQTNMHTCVPVYVCVYEERERISVTLVTAATQGCANDLCMRTRACVLVLFR